MNEIITQIDARIAEHKASVEANAAEIASLENEAAAAAAAAAAAIERGYAETYTNETKRGEYIQQRLACLKKWNAGTPFTEEEARETEKRLEAECAAELLPLYHKMLKHIEDGAKLYASIAAVIQVFRDADYKLSRSAPRGAVTAIFKTVPTVVDAALASVSVNRVHELIDNAEKQTQAAKR